MILVDISYLRGAKEEHNMKRLLLILGLLISYNLSAALLAESEVELLCDTAIERSDYFEFAYYLNENNIAIKEAYKEIKCDYSAYGMDQMPLFFGLSVPHHNFISRLFQKFIREGAEIELSCAIGFQTYPGSPNETVIEMMKKNYRMWSQLNSDHDDYVVIRKVRNFYKSVIPLYENHLKNYPILNPNVQCVGF